MNTTKATYWIALAAFAIGLNSEYQQGKFPALHTVAGHVESTVCRISTRAQQTLAMAGFVIGRQALPAYQWSRKTTEMADARADLREAARDRAEMLREQLRAQAARMHAQAQLQRDQVRQIRYRVRAEMPMVRASRRMAVVDMQNCSKAEARAAVNSVRESIVVSSDEDDSY
jgi:hypothetical protein